MKKLLFTGLFLSSIIGRSTNLAVVATANCDSGGMIHTSVSGGASPYHYRWSGSAQADSMFYNYNVYGLTNGSYTVTVTDANGITGTAIAAVSCGSVPLSVNAYAACDTFSGGYVTAIATGGAAPITYLWSDGTASAYDQNLTNGTYSVTVSDANGQKASSVVTINCSSNTGSRHCKAKFYYYPDSTQAHTIIIVNQSIGVNEKWHFGDGQTLVGDTGSHVYNNPGSYDVCLTVSDSVNHCSDSTCINLSVFRLTAIYKVIITAPATNIPTAVSELAAQDPGLKVYPNPAKGMVNISYTLGNNSNVNIGVYDVLGNKVMNIENQQKSSGAYQIQVNADQLSAGMYLLKLNTNDHVTTTRLMVTK